MTKQQSKPPKNRGRRGVAQSPALGDDAGLQMSPSTRPTIRWPWILALFVVASIATFFLVKFFVPMPLPDSIVGAWQVTNGELTGCKFYFERDGSFRTKVDGKPVSAVVRYDGTNLQFIWNNPVTGQNEVETQTIKHVNAKELVLQVSSGQSVKLVRMTP